ncbi:helix-turn-helix domain-containing protein [Sporosarcina highlanderae]|uniref:Helix-turn-helix domain-containing protein n=1 Tax=Sporosarcina highlanderae TaxID=3035916 RepID=A0ABT8JV13_9BACL|nr:helix-turn-helix domain-containing protein [Sporosarcina highlanderae]MDN4609005.1 helix-turn-helix domain-containing protein [Sporosarcina highlanderae]
MTYYLRDYSRFETIAEMDAAAEQHLMKHWNDLTKSDIQVFDIIRRYSVKYGAAHLKHATIEKAIGKSNATVRRAITKLASLGIIEKVHFIRPVMSGLGANIYVILPFNEQGKMNDRDHVEESREVKESEQISKDQALLSKSLVKSKDLNYTSQQESSKLSTSLFSRMKDLLAGTLGDSKLAREFFGIHRAISGRMLKYEIYQGDGHIFEDLAYRALMITVMATKKKVIRNLPGYFKGVLDKLVDDIYFKDIFMLYDKPIEGFYCPEGL